MIVDFLFMSQRLVRSSGAIVLKALRLHTLPWSDVLVYIFGSPFVMEKFFFGTWYTVKLFILRSS